MVFKIFSKENIDNKQKLVDVREAFNLWDMLKSKYTIIERLETNGEFLHDKDLKMIIDSYVKTLNNNKKILEDLLRTYQLPGPDQGRCSVHWAGNSEPIRDEFIAREALIFIQEHIENMLRTSRTSVTNDNVREVVTKMLKETLEKAEGIYGYLKLKGWIDTPPLYPNIPSHQKEKISCAAASHLWDHITLRYDNLRETKVYHSMANDGEFKAIIKRGIDQLNKQTNLLEDECKKFGITLPKRPAEVIIPPGSSEIYGDDQMYKDIFKGLQGAGILHTEALKQITYNDRVRKIFKDFLDEEIDFYNNFVKYGKMKGWLHPVPAYQV